MYKEKSGIKYFRKMWDEIIEMSDLLRENSDDQFLLDFVDKVYFSFHQMAHRFEDIYLRLRELENCVEELGNEEAEEN